MRFAPAHAFSGFAGLALVLAARAQDPGGDPILRHPGPAPELRVAGIYDPRDAVRLAGTFDVPPHKLLIMTAIGSVQAGLASVTIYNFWPNGTPEQISVNTTSTALTVPFPSPGIVVPPGAQLFGGVVYGYLVDAPDTKSKVRWTGTPPDAARIVGIPGDPREYVYFQEQCCRQGLAVPMGKRLVVTAVGGATEVGSLSLRVNGNTFLLTPDLPSGTLYYELPAPGMVYDEGQTLVVASNRFPDGRAIGYFVDM